MNRLTTLFTSTFVLLMVGLMTAGDSYAVMRVFSAARTEPKTEEAARAIPVPHPADLIERVRENADTNCDGVASMSEIAMLYAIGRQGSQGVVYAHTALADVDGDHQITRRDMWAISVAFRTLQPRTSRFNIEWGANLADEVDNKSGRIHIGEMLKAYVDTLNGFLSVRTQAPSAGDYDKNGIVNVADVHIASLVVGEELAVLGDKKIAVDAFRFADTVGNGDGRIEMIELDEAIKRLEGRERNESPDMAPSDPLYHMLILLRDVMAADTDVPCNI